MWRTSCRFYWFGREYVFAAWPEPMHGAATEFEARSVIHAAAADTFGRSALLEVLSPRGINFGDVEARALAALASGGLCVGVVRPRTFAVSTSAGHTAEPIVDELEEAPVAVEPVSDHWIEVELVDEDGAPVPFERFELVSADGRRRGGQLNDRGFARVERLDDTQYDLHFPNLPADGCSRA